MDWKEIANKQHVSPPVCLTIHHCVYKWEPIGSPLDQRDEADGETHNEQMQWLNPAVKKDK